MVNDAAQILLGVAAVMIVASAALLIWRKGFASAKFDLGPIKAELRAINRAVNNVSPGDPTLLERVKRTELRMEWIIRTLLDMADKLDAKVSDPPE